MPDTVNVLLIGGGGREHAIASAISRSPRLGRLYVTHPENPGLAALGTPVDVPVNIREIYRLVQFCEHKQIGLVVIGPEDPLAEGYADKLAAAGRLVFGPTREGAQIESDKAWAKQLMRGAAIPTAESRTFTDAQAAIAYLESREHAPVVKAAGLAKGKGVFVPATIAEAIDAVKRIMIAKEFGEAGRKVLLEERLSGPEVSVLAIVDGRTIMLLPPAQDHKRLLDGDKGPNTGGMGVYCPANVLTDAQMERVERDVLVPAVDAMRRDGIDYKGVLYAGLMLTPSGPKVLEFNCRFGDPECQAILPRLKADLLEIMLAACKGELDACDVAWDSSPACCVVLASEGYPEKPRAGAVITGIDKAQAMPGVHVFHAGTTLNTKGEIVTAGGRVLSVTALGDTLAQARERAYAACAAIEFPGKVMRTDIGLAASRA